MIGPVGEPADRVRVDTGAAVHLQAAAPAGTEQHTQRVVHAERIVPSGLRQDELGFVPVGDLVVGGAEAVIALQGERSGLGP